ncbi:MAG TPA: radical SAM protein, partial [bacterium]|nr:radical SAM protein [bacterium]
EKAMETFKKRAELGPVREENLKLGRYAREAGDIEGALRFFVRGRPSSPDTYQEDIGLNEIEKTEGRKTVKARPKGLIVTLTTRCNLQCIMCGVPNVRWDLPETTAGEIRELFPYLKKVHWQGGEVFLVDTFQKLFKEAASYPQMEQHINTNGLLLDESWCRILSRSRVNLDFSIDGVSASTYEYIRKGGRFDRLLENLRLLNRLRKESGENKMVLTLNFVVMKSNYREAIHIMDFAREYGFSSLQLSPVGCITGEENIFLHRDKEAIAYLKGNLPPLFEKARKYSLDFRHCLPLESRDRSEEKETRDILRADPPRRTVSSRCYLPWEYLFIDGSGNVFPYCFCPEALGNLKQFSLLDLWNNEKMRHYRTVLAGGSENNICSRNCLSGCVPEDVLKRQLWDNE